MGAERFETQSRGKDAAEAFKLARDKALHDHGHRGYTGTIAEKRSFAMAETKEGESTEATIARIATIESHWSNNKWADAACVDAGVDGSCAPGERVFIFFGWASS